MSKLAINQDRRGVNAIESLFLGWGWFFREQPVSDWGVDAHVEIVKDDGPTGKLIALQIKTGPSWFRKRGEDYVFYGEARHRSYWSRHSLPVFLILHDPDTGLTLWQKIEPHLIIEGRKGGWSILIPKENLLNDNAKFHFEEVVASDPNSQRRFMLAVDYPLMVETTKRPVYLMVEEWVNKSLGIRDAVLWFDEEDESDPQHHFSRWYPTHDLAKYMAIWFPWAKPEYVAPVEEFSGELATHRFLLKLSLIGQAYVDLEQFYANGRDEHDELEPPEDPETITEDEWNDLWMERAIERDSY